MFSTSSSSKAPSEVVEAKPYPSLPIESSSDLLPGSYKRQRSQREDSMFSNAFWHPTQREDDFCPNAFSQSIQREDGFFPYTFRQSKDMSPTSSSSNAPQAVASSEEEGSTNVNQNNANDDSASVSDTKRSFGPL